MYFHTSIHADITRHQCVQYGYAGVDTHSPNAANKQQLPFTGLPELKQQTYVAFMPSRHRNYKMATRDVLPGAVDILRLGFMCFYGNTINAEMNLLIISLKKECTFNTDV